MKARVRSIVNDFIEYEVDNVLTVHYIGCNLIINYMVESGVPTLTYNSANVIVEILEY